MPTFQERDPNTPEFWSERFEQKFMPWDRGGVPAALRRFTAAQPRPLVTLIPGCGSGHEVAFLCEAGWDVTAIDFSPAAVAAARQTPGCRADRVREADFFVYQPPQTLDFIYERAFLCALPRARWPAVVARWAELLPAGGLLGGFFFFDNAPKGPPFGANEDELHALLGRYFQKIEDCAVDDSIPAFAGKERWQLWRRQAG